MRASPYREYGCIVLEINGYRFVYRQTVASAKLDGGRIVPSSENSGIMTQWRGVFKREKGRRNGMPGLLAAMNRKLTHVYPCFLCLVVVAGAAVC